MDKCGLIFKIFKFKKCKQTLIWAKIEKSGQKTIEN